MEKIILDGDCALTNCLDGDCALTNCLDGVADKIIRYRETVYYTGEYDITPSQTRQTIPIAQLTAAHDLIIEPIPNNYGLITWNGASLVVS